ncbi:MAG: DUF1080 domain-containing protein [Planctomycetales bacterium]
MTCLVVGQEAKPRVYVDPTQAGADFRIQGEYEGKLGKEAPVGIQLVAQGDGQFEGTIFSKGLPGAGWDRSRLPIRGTTKDGVVQLTGTNFTARIDKGRLTGTLDDAPLDCRRVERQSPTLGAKPPSGALVLFDGTNLEQWQGGRIQEGNLLGVGTRTKKTFKNFTLHVEFRTPYQPYDRGQGRGNSGMYLGDQYEFQILDSFGLSGENNECGGYYSMAKPALNMCLPPLTWQTYDVEFSMAQFDGEGKKIKPAVATIRLNGVVIHDKYEIPRFNGGGGLMDESKPGSIYFQDHSNPVHFRNVWILEKN